MGKLEEEEEEKGKNWERGLVFGLLLADKGRVRRLVVKKTVRDTSVCEEEERWVMIGRGS